MDAYVVELEKLRRVGLSGYDGEQIRMVVEAKNAVEAVYKVDKYTGNYPVTSIVCKKFDGSIYPTDIK